MTKNVTDSWLPGGMGHMVLSSYSSAMIVAGGSGVSFALAAAEELMQSAVRRTSRVRFIEIVWIVQSQGMPSSSFRRRMPLILQLSRLARPSCSHILCHSRSMRPMPLRQDAHFSPLHPRQSRSRPFRG